MKAFAILSVILALASCTTADPMAGDHIVNSGGAAIQGRRIKFSSTEFDAFTPVGVNGKQFAGTALRNEELVWREIPVGEVSLQVQAWTTRGVRLMQEVSAVGVIPFKAESGNKYVATGRFDGFLAKAWVEEVATGKRVSPEIEIRADSRSILH